MTLLHDTEESEAPVLGRRVVIYGGGDTAMDAARTARRLGAEDAVVVYRRTRERMPANVEEVQDAVDEGVRLKWLSTIVGTEGESLTIERMELDADGFPQPTGEIEELRADSVILALGQEADLSLLGGDAGDHGGRRGRRGRRRHDDGPTGRVRRRRHGGGRAHPDRRHRPRQEGGTGHRRLAGRRQGERPHRHELATPEHLNTWYYADAPHAVRPRLEAARRTSTFDEVVGGLDE